MANNLSKTKKNFIFNFLYQLLVISVPLITTPYLARILGPEGLGEYSYAYAIACYFVLFLQMGIKNYGTREIAKYQHKPKDLSRAFWELISCQWIFSVIAIVIYLWYTFSYASNKLISLLFLPYLISGAIDITWCFSGLEDFRIIVGRSTFIKITTTLCIFLFVKTNTDIATYTCIMAGGMFLSQFLLWPFLFRYIRFIPISTKQLFRHFKPLVLLFIPILAESVYKIMGKIMLGRMADLSQVGFYDSSDKIMQLPLILIVSLGTVMLPRITHLYATDSEKQAVSVFKKSIYITVFLATSTSFGIMAIAKTFVPWFYGPDFTLCVTLFQILLPSCIFFAFASVIRSQYLIPKEQDKEFIISIMAGAVVNILVNWCLIPKYGAIGASIGTLCAEMTVCFVQIAMVYKGIPIFHCLFSSLPFIIAGMGMYLCVLHLNFAHLSSILNLALQCLLGAGVYLLIFGITSRLWFKSDFEELKNIVVRTVREIKIFN